MKTPILAILLSLPALARGETPVTLDAHLGLSHDDNVARAAENKDIQSDTIFEAGLGLGLSQPINANSNLLINADASLRQYQDYDKLSHHELGLEMTYQLQLQNRYNSPWYYLSARYALLEYDSSFRDGDYIEIGIGLGRRLTDRLKIMAGVKRYDSNADNSNFDTASNSFYVNLDYLPDSSHTLYALLTLGDGDIVSTSSNPWPSQLQGSGHYHTGDDAFPGFTDPWAYNLNATTLSLRLGDSMALSPQQSLDLSAMYYNADADYNLSYNGLVVDVTYFYRF